jgi:hypothetical protein
MSTYEIMRLSGPFPWTLLTEHGPARLRDHERLAFATCFAVPNRGRMDARASTFGLKTRRDARRCIEWLNAVRALDVTVMEDRLVAMMPACPSEYALAQLRSAIRAVMAASVSAPQAPNQTKE